MDYNPYIGPVVKTTYELVTITSMDTLVILSNHLKFMKFMEFGPLSLGELVERFVPSTWRWKIFYELRLELVGGCNPFD